jgi:hypothetical protein
VAQQTIETIARTVKSEMASDVNLEIVAQFVSQRIMEVYSKSKFKSLRRYGELNIAATIGSIDGSSGGTVTVTPGSNICTGDSVAATVWNNTLEGRFFRIFPLKTWYRIAKVDPPATITLDSPVSTERNTDLTVGVPLPGQSYYIAQKFIPLAPDARYLGTFTLPYYFMPIEFTSPEEMNRRYPSRYLVGPYPWVLSEFGTDWGQSNKPKIVEVYPYTTIATVMPYTYWASPPMLAFDDELPPTFDPHIAREMAMIPCYRYEYMRAMRQGNVQGAELLRNEFRSQETRMDDWVDQALKSDNGSDDITFIMSRYQSRKSADFDPVTSSRDDVWMRRG